MYTRRCIAFLKKEDSEKIMGHFMNSSKKFSTFCTSFYIYFHLRKKSRVARGWGPITIDLHNVNNPKGCFAVSAKKLKASFVSVFSFNFSGSKTRGKVDISDI